ncbi:MAG: hypothetical protein H7319_01525 [Spirosoma sp.]|nr:hypothetical protein [Spirosoma sp.]
MQRRNLSGRRSDGRRSESILLYGFGLALALSLAFNGFLLHEQSRRQSIFYEYGSIQPDPPTDVASWQQQLSDCAQANERKDSLIHWLERPPIPPDQSNVVQRKTSE